MLRDEKAAALAAKKKFDLNDLITLVEVLRSENGCPWDREQTHQSIRKNLIEETYEVIEAIDNSDDNLLREELGDLLFQVVFHARLAEERGVFGFDDVANDVCAKMILRHPHVFGDVCADTTDKVLDNWDRIKMKSKEQKSTGEVLDSVSRALPSLMRAAKIAGKIRKAEESKKSREEMIGDLLYEISALCDGYDIDPEKALYDACERKIEEKKNET